VMEPTAPGAPYTKAGKRLMNSDTLTESVVSVVSR